MKGLVITELRRTVTLGWSADRWELFTVMPGVADAAKRLNVAFSRAASEPNATAYSVRQAMFRAMAKERDYGANDSEPLQHLDALIDEVFGKQV